MTSAVDLYVLYKFIKAISTPFDETKAFELGIVDKKGKLLKKPKTKAVAKPKVTPKKSEKTVKAEDSTKTNDAD